mgnify:CR=1 FL=1
MSKYIPFDNMVLVKVINDKPEIKSGIILTDKIQSRYVEYQILDLGDSVTWKGKVKIGDIVVGNPTPDNEYIDKENGIKLINSKDIFAKKEEVRTHA